MFFRLLILSLLFYMGYRVLRNIFWGLTGGGNFRDEQVGTTQSQQIPNEDPLEREEIEDASFEEIEDDIRN